MLLQLPQPYSQKMTDLPSSYSCSSLSNATSQQGQEFTVAAVEHEHIVRFNGFYTAATRKAYIDSALTASGKRTPPPPTYSILTRDNPMAGRPSDFDVVRWEAGDGLEGGPVAAADWLDRLRAHPAVRSVSQEKRLTRRVLEVTENEEPEPGKKFIMNQFSYGTGSYQDSATDPVGYPYFFAGSGSLI